MATKLATDFLDRVKRSGLVTEDKLSQVLQQLGASGVDLENPDAISAALVANETLTRWQAEKLQQGKHKGFFIGSYRLLKPLGRGGMGAVFLAQHEMMRRRCAVKVLPQTQLKEGSSVLERFYVEAQAVAALDHQNIVRAYDVNKEVKEGKEIHYLVMEFVDGTDLQTMVQAKGTLDYVKAADFLRQTAQGLAHAHENGLVHRDIKPANLLVDTKGTIKILDLGLARFFDDSSRASLTTAYNETVLGTADYLSPEQALNSHTVDHRTDIYSLGCTGYYMLTGHPPFPEGTVAQRLVAHQIKSPKPIVAERSDAPAGLVAIIDKMMAKEPDDRQPTATVVARELAAWLMEQGGEDWRRQHEDLASDSSLRHAAGMAPTVASSSVSSETELGLAPLEAPDWLGSGSGSNLRKKGDSECRKGPGASTSKDMLLADSQGPLVRPAPVAAAPEPVVKLDTMPAAGLEQLAPLTPMADLTAMNTQELAAALSGSDLLGTPAAKAMGAANAPDPLSAISSQMMRIPGRTPGSSSSIRRGPESKETKGGLRSVGLPVLIGGGVGLVVLLLAVYAFFGGFPSGPEQSAPVVVGQAPPQPSPPQSQSQSKPPTPKAKGNTDKPATPPARPDQKRPESNPPAATTGQTKFDPGASAPPKVASAKPAESIFGQVPRETGSASPTLPDQRKSEEKGRAATNPANTTGPGRPGEEPDKSKDKGRPDSKEKESSKSAELSPEERKTLFGKVKVMYVEFKSDVKNRPPEVDLMIAREIKEAANEAGLATADNADAILRVTMSSRQNGPYNVIELSSRLECKVGEKQTVEVWSHKSDVAALAGVVNTRTISGLMRKEVSKHYSQFTRACREARK